MIRSKHMIDGQWVFTPVWSSIKRQNDIRTGLPESEKDPRPVYLVLGIEPGQREATWCIFHADGALDAKAKAMEEFGYSSAWAYLRKSNTNASYDKNKWFFVLLDKVNEHLANGVKETDIRRFVKVFKRPEYEMEDDANV